MKGKRLNLISYEKYTSKKNIIFKLMVLISALSFGQQQLNYSRTDFFVDLNYGVHTPTNGYKYDNGLTTCDKLPNNSIIESEYSQTIENFDIDGFVDDLVAIGAGYVVLNLGQRDGKYCSPNLTYQEKFLLDETKSGYLTSLRDLPNDLYQKLEEKNIKLFLYLNLDGPSQVTGWKNVGNNIVEQYYIADERMGLDYDYQTEDCIVYDDGSGLTTVCTEPPPPIFTCKNGTLDIGDIYRSIVDSENFNRIKITDEFVNNWADIIKEWSDRYQGKISGWFFDHAYQDQSNKYSTGYGFKQYQLSIIRNAALSGNSEAIIAFNEGAIDMTHQDKLGNHTGYQDFTFGEVSPAYSGSCGQANAINFNLDSLMNLWQNSPLYKGRSVLNQVSYPSFSSQFHALITLGDRWTCANVHENKTADKWSPYLHDIIKEGGVTTISIANVLSLNGRIPQEQLDELEKINSYVINENCNYHYDMAVKIKNLNSGKFLEAKTNDRGEVLIQHDEGVYSDSWLIDDIPDVGNENLIRIFNTRSHKYLTIKNGNTGITARIIQQDWYDWSSQKWILEDQPDGSVAIKSFHHADRYVTVNQGSINNDAEIQINDWNNWTSQKWLLNPINPIKIRNVQSDKYITASSTDILEILVQHESGLYDDWAIQDLPDQGGVDLVRLYNINTDKYMTIKNGNTGIGSRIIQQDWYDWSSQKWILEDQPDGSVAIKSFHHADRYVTVNQGSLNNNAEIQINDWNNWASQKWFFNNQLNSSSYQANLSNVFLGRAKNNLSIILYPNPTKDLIEIDLRNNGDIKLEELVIYDLNFRKVKQYRFENGNGQEVISIGDLEKGLYFFEIKHSSSKNPIFKKVLKK